MEREQITEREIKAKVSVPALIVLYLSIPAFIFLPVIFPTIVLNVKYRLKKIAEDAITDATGLPSLDSVKGEISDRATQAINDEAGGCLTSARNFMLTMTVILLIVWVVWCVVMTFRHFDNKLSICGKTVTCSSGRNGLTTSLDKIDNVFVEQSVWGKLFNYGNITVSSKNGSITAKNISSPTKIAEVLKSEIN